MLAAKARSRALLIPLALVLHRDDGVARRAQDCIGALGLGNDPRDRERFKDKVDDFFIQPAAIADEAWQLARQPRSAWSFLTELRPYGESW